MSECVKPEELRQYVSGEIADADFVRVDTHVAECEKCRAGLLTEEDVAEAEDEEFRWPPPGGSPCLDEEQIAACAKDTLDAVSRKTAEAHLQHCALCAAEVRALRKFREEMEPYAGVDYGPASQLSPAARAAAATVFTSGATVTEAPARAPGPLPGHGWSLWSLFTPQRGFFGILAPICLILLALLIRQIGPAAVAPDNPPQLPNPLTPRVAQLRTELTASQRDAAASKQSAQQTQQQLQAARGTIRSKDARLAQVRNELHETKRQLAARPPTQPPLPSPEPAVPLALAFQELLTRKMVTPLQRILPALANLAADRTRGGSGPVLLSPVRTFVLTTRPTFRWENAASAVHYIVELFDGADRRIWWKKVDAPGPQAAPSVQLAYPAETQLQPGKTYTWRVTAVRPPPSDTGALSGESSPPEAARFRVLGGRDRQRLLDLKDRYAKAPLLLAALYQREGLYYESEQVLKSLQRQNPQSAEIGAMLKELDERAKQDP